MRASETCSSYNVAIIMSFCFTLSPVFTRCIITCMMFNPKMNFLLSGFGDPVEDNIHWNSMDVHFCPFFLKLAILFVLSRLCSILTVDDFQSIRL